MRLSRLSRYYYLRYIRLQGDPRKLALGTAIGVFVGMTPTMPFHTIIIVSLALLTKTSAMVGILVSWIVCNPFTCLPLYYSAMVIGNLITPGDLSWFRVKNLLNSFTFHQDFLHSVEEITRLGLETIAVMLVGGVAQAIPFAILSYYLSLYFFKNLRKTKTKTLL